MKAYTLRHTFKDISTAFDLLWYHNDTNHAKFVCKIVIFEKLKTIRFHQSCILYYYFEKH